MTKSPSRGGAVETFSLTAFLGRASEHGTTARQIAEWAWANVPTDHRDHLAIEALTGAVPGALALMRSSARTGSSPAAATLPSGLHTHSRWVDAGSTYKRYLAVKINVGDGHLKVFGDCTQDDVLHAATVRFDIAENTRREGLRFKAFHAAMLVSGATTVADLDEDLVVEIIRSNP